MSISAPAALEFESVHVKHHHASAQITIGRIKFVSGLVKTNLFNLANDHRRRRRILGAKSRDRFRAGCASRRIGWLTPAGRWEKSRDRPATAVARGPGTFRSGITSTSARLCLLDAP